MRRKTQRRPAQAGFRQFPSDQALFLADMPPTIEALLEWFRAGARPEGCSKELEEFACAFLGALADDQALIPMTDTHPAKLLMWVFTHHLRNPSHGGAWLNLGFALRLIAKSDQEPLKSSRLQRAIECFDRSLAANSPERPVSIRAWAGKAFTFGQLGKFEEAARCSREAVELDRSDPNLWLLHSSCVGMAGRKEEALELVQEAYHAYLMAGRPEGLRYLFDSVIPPTNAPEPTQHLRRVQ